MKLDQLQYFVETARRQHIGQAARFLNISPGAISHSISQLEEELGRNLFEKQGRQIRLTHHGKMLFEKAESLLRDAARIRDEFSSQALELRGHHRIAATHWLAKEYLTPAWMKLMSRSDKLTGTLQSLRSGEVLSRVGTGEIDLGICFSPHSGPTYDQETLLSGKLILAFGKRHPFLKDKNMEKLEKFPSIAALAAQGIENCETHPALERYQVRPRVSMLYDSYEVALEALKQNEVWTLLPDFLVAGHRGELESFVPRGWNEEYRVSAVWPKYRMRSAALDVLISDVRHRLKESSK